MSTKQNTDFDVVIIGCGPTGATLANLLAISGVKVLILEREHDIYNLPRAVHFDDETMRVFQSVGIADELKDLVRVNPGMRFVDTNNRILLDWPRPQSIGTQGWHASYRLHQPDLERLLRSAITEQSNCTLLTGHNVVDIQQHENHASVSYSSDKSASTTVTASYLIGCDGANSFVRSSLNIELEDLGFKERWLVVDVLLKRDMPELGDYTIQYCDPIQPTTYCRNPALRRRWEMSLSDSISDTEAKSDSRIWSLLSRWVCEDDAVIERKAVYTFRSALVQTWRRKRIILAGDAAHLTPPFMGQGMCAGIRDAANLAWKLSQCIKNENSDKLLDSYTQERRPHVLQYINTAIDLGRLINSIDHTKAGQLKSQASNGNQKMASLSPKLGSTDLAINTDLMSDHVGSLAAQPLLNDDQKLDDYCGYAFVLLVRSAESISSVDRNTICYVAGDMHPDVMRLLNELNATAVLIRPDRYILGVASSDKSVTSLVDYMRTMN